MIAMLFDRRLLVLAVLFVLALGAGAIQTLPRAEDPTIQARSAAITTPYPGASALRVEALVTQVIEEELRTLAEIDEITSTSRADVSIVSLQLLDEIDDVAPVWSRVRDKLADIAPLLPEGAGDPDLNDDAGYAYTVAFAVRAEGEAVDDVILQRYAHELADVLRSVPETEHVEVHGDAPEVVEVSVSETALQAAGLDVSDVAGALARSDARASAGAVAGADTALTVELAGSFDTLDRLRGVPIATSSEGSLVLGDLATLQRTVAAPAPEVAFLDGERAIFVGARMQPGARVDLWVPTVLKAVEGADRHVRGIETVLVFEQAGYTTERLASVLVSLVQGLAIVVVVLFFTMGIRAALSVGLAIPLTALMTVALFPLAGITLHQMSIIGIVVALGLMVDNAIIMTNDLQNDLTRGHSHREAARIALRKLFFPLLASTVTTMLAFMPIILLPGGAGEFVGPMSIAVICALASSFVVSMFFVPALSPMLLRAPGGSQGGWLARGVSLGPIARAFAAATGFLIRRPLVGLALSVAPVAVGMASLPTVPTVFFPFADRDQFRLEIKLPQSTVIDRTAELAREISTVVRAQDGVTRTMTFVGAAAPQLYYNVVSSESANPAYADMIVDAVDPARTASLIPALQRELSALFPEAAIAVHRYAFGPPVGAPIELRIHGPDLDTLAGLGQRAAGILADVPGTVRAQSTLHRDAVKLEVQVDEDAARRAGLDLGAIAEQLDGALSGRQGGFVLEGSERLPVSVRLRADRRRDATDLTAASLIPVGANETAAGVPLAAIASIRPVPAWTDIERIDGRRYQSVSAFVEYGVLPSTVQDRFEQALGEAGFEVPPGYRMGFEGAQGQRTEAVGRLLSQVTTLLVAAVTVLVLTFGSFRRMGLVFASGILALGFGFLVLSLSGHPFGFIIVVGVMGLIGVGLNDTIVILSALDGDEDARTGRADAVTAVVTGEAARHIWSTTITTAGGFVPLILLGGDFWPPFATVFAGGLLLLTLIAFVFTPCAYRLVLARQPADGMRPRHTGTPRTTAA